MSRRTAERKPPGRNRPGGSLSLSGVICRERDRYRYLILSLVRYQTTHQIDQVGREQRILSGLLEPEAVTLQNFDVLEPNSLQFQDEDTLRQGSGHSPGPCGGVSQDLGRQLGLVDREVGDTHPALWLEHATRLGQHPTLAGGEIDRTV